MITIREFKRSGKNPEKKLVDSHIRLYPEEYEMLMKFSRKHDLSMSSAVRYFCTLGMQTHRRRNALRRSYGADAEKQMLREAVIADLRECWNWKPESGARTGNHPGVFIQGQEEEMSEKIRIVIAEPGKAPAVSFITESLKDMQQIVDGYIELFEVTESGIDLFCNEEGKLLSLEPNRYFSELADVICGTIIAIGHDGEGAAVSLTEEQVMEALNMFTEKYPPAAFIMLADGILVMPVNGGPEER